MAQAYQNWHLYLVNDGGDPNPVTDLCRSHQSVFSGRLTVFHNEFSGGLAKALNTALRVVEGDFVVIHDDDDRWDASYLAVLVAFLSEPTNDRFAGVMSRFCYVFERMDGNEVHEINRRIVKNWPTTLKFFPLIYWNAFPPICYLMRMRAVKAIGLADENLTLLEDTDYLRRLLIYGDVATLNECLAFYHVRPQISDGDFGNSTVTMTNKYNAYDRMIGNGLVRQYLEDNPANLGLIYAIGGLSTHLDELRNDFEMHITSEEGLKRIAAAVWEERKRRSFLFKALSFMRKLFAFSETKTNA